VGSAPSHTITGWMIIMGRRLLNHAVLLVG
jgi:hypothetical protein